MTSSKDYDAIIIGSGMGGMSTAALLANDGFKVLILEQALHPGGCSSSYPRKGYVFESGATTLIGFDEQQPLRFLEDKTGITIPKVELSVPMKVRLDGKEITRYKDLTKWIAECDRVFGELNAQQEFWTLAKKISDVVWKVSLRNPFFPPKRVSEWGRLFTSNNPMDVWVLAYAFQSVHKVIEKCGITNPDFYRFVDEQLMITAQSKTTDTPFIFGAAGLTYTNYSNYYVPGGLINMINAISDFVEERDGSLKTKEGATSVKQTDGGFQVQTIKGHHYNSPVVVSNIPVWNMSDLTNGKMKSYFGNESDKYNEAWGAITMGIATTDAYPDDDVIHHQIHLGKGKTVPFTNSASIFVSMSQRGDSIRAPEGERVLNISCHADPETWFNMGDNYDKNKKVVHEFIINELNERLPGFSDSEILIADTATPVSWQSWVSRKKGRVGGIPQSMARSLLDWTPNETPFKGLYLVGDTTYPGQGIPGVTLGGINVYSRIKKYH